MPNTPGRIRYVHTNLVARDWRKLARFYTDAFGCTPVPPERHLEGGWVEDLTGLLGAEIHGAHLRLPGPPDGPTLEIFEYLPEDPRQGNPAINRQGLGHLGFLVDSVEEVVEAVLRHGGSLVGETVQHDYERLGTLTAAYVRDPEGNCIELQHWKLSADAMN